MIRRACGADIDAADDEQASAARRPHDPRRLLLAIAVAVAAVSTSVGCATPPPFRQPPDFSARFEGVERITLVPPKVAVYRMSAGGVEEEVQDWSDTAYAHVVEAVRAEVEELGRTFVEYEGEALPHRVIRHDGHAAERAATAGRTAAEDSWLLFETANIAILRHTYDPWNVFPERSKNFDYTLGTEAAALLGPTRADAFLLVIATDHIPTRERAALVAAGLAVGAMTASYSGPSATPAKLTLALVESSTGDLLWFNTLSLPFSDLRDEAADQALVDTLMKGLPR